MKNKKLRLFTTPNLKFARPRAKKKRRVEEEEENLDATNGCGKTKSNAFTTPNLKCLLVLEQKKKEESRRRRNEEERNGFVFGQKGEK